RRRGAACTRRGLGTCGHGRGFSFGFGRAGVERFRVRVRRLEAREALAAGLQSARRLADGRSGCAASDLSGPSVL
uniref:Uncharacterized protein n=1 Tax=Cucumis melo TaxID=3656 RepID=A0A9I9E362_CUCME